MSTPLTGYIQIYDQSNMKCQPTKSILIPDYLRKKIRNEKCASHQRSTSYWKLLNMTTLPVK